MGFSKTIKTIYGLPLKMGLMFIIMKEMNLKIIQPKMAFLVMCFTPL